jgi:putative FmdB family regulatory protein
MPLYEYECTACGHRFERIQKFSDPPADTCPKCGGALRKLMSSPAFQFKGSGWYVTDYAKKEPSGGGKTDTTATNETKSETKSEKTEKSSPESSTAAPAASTAAKD